LATGIPRKSSSERGRPNGAEPALHYGGKAQAEAVRGAPYERSALVCEVNPPAPANRLYYGDNLDVLMELAGGGIKGMVRLAYIDPPFSTNGRFECRNRNAAYDDTLQGAEYVEFMRRRLLLIHDLLSDDGSMYLHLDSNMVFHMKLVMDEVFGGRNFRALITRRKCSNKNYTRNTYGNVSDYILFYTKTDDYVWNRPYVPWDEDRILKEYPCLDEGTGRRYKKVPIHAPGERNGGTGRPWRGVSPPPGKHWQYPPERLEELDRNGEIYWSRTGNPRRKVYLDESEGVPVQDIWLDCRDSVNQNDRVTGYPTEKNIGMLRRIVSASSGPGDLVMDCFCGSGSTLDAASQLGRAWIGIDSSIEAIGSTVRRFTEGTGRHGDYVTGGQGRPLPPTPGEGFGVYVSPCHDAARAEEVARLLEGHLPRPRAAAQAALGQSPAGGPSPAGAWQP